MSIEELNEDDDLQELDDESNEQQTQHEDGDEHQHVIKSDGDDEEESSVKRDRELDDAASDEERESIRERRRQDRRNKNQRQKAKIEGLERRLDSLAQQNATLSQQLAGVQNATLGQSIAALDKEIVETQRAIGHYSDMEASAMKAQNVDAYKIARQKGDEVKARLWQLNSLKGNVTQASQRPQQNAIDPEVTRLATDFHRKHSWYRGPQSNDDDSYVLSMLDAKLVREGWNPATEGYWSELDARLAKHLPHRAKQPVAQQSQTQAAPQRQQQRSPVAGSSEGTTPTGKRTIHLSEERVKALKDAGMWNDPKKRERAIKSFQAYDKANGAAR